MDFSQYLNADAILSTISPQRPTDDIPNSSANSSSVKRDHTDADEKENIQNATMQNEKYDSTVASQSLGHRSGSGQMNQSSTLDPLQLDVSSLLALYNANNDNGRSDMSLQTNGGTFPKLPDKSTKPDQIHSIFGVHFNDGAHSESADAMYASMTEKYVHRETFSSFVDTRSSNVNKQQKLRE